MKILGIVVALAVAGAIAISAVASKHKEKILLSALTDHMAMILVETKALAVDGTMPSAVEVAEFLRDPRVAEELHVSSLFATDDMYYVKERHRIDTSETVYCARVGDRLFAITGTGCVKVVEESHLDEEKMIPIPEIKERQPGTTRQHGSATGHPGPHF